MLSHKQVLSVGDRNFRWEYPEGSPLAVSVLSAYPSANVKILVPVDKSPLPRFTDRGGWLVVLVSVIARVCLVLHHLFIKFKLVIIAGIF